MGAGRDARLLVAALRPHPGAGRPRLRATALRAQRPAAQGAPRGWSAAHEGRRPHVAQGPLSDAGFAQLCSVSAGDQSLRLDTCLRSERASILYVWRFGLKLTGLSLWPNVPWSLRVSFFQTFHFLRSTR